MTYTTEATDFEAITRHQAMGAAEAQEATRDR